MSILLVIETLNPRLCPISEPATEFDILDEGMLAQALRARGPVG